VGELVAELVRVQVSDAGLFASALDDRVHAVAGHRPFLAEPASFRVRFAMVCSEPDVSAESLRRLRAERHSSEASAFAEDADRVGS
jgi:hypothetical protein